MVMMGFLVDSFSQSSSQSPAVSPPDIVLVSLLKKMSSLSFGKVLGGSVS